MGCLQTRFGSSGGARIEEEEEEAPKQYSWDKREKVDPKDFTIERVKGETVVRLPGSINGQQFIIQNCEDANIYLFDHIATISIDDCINCRVFVGPVKTSAFIRDCKQCKLMIACQQFRTRDCQKIDTFISCVSQPIIESSTGMKFGCFQYNYPGLEGQFKSAGLSVYNNNWSNIHDFTPVPGENNFGYLPENPTIEDYITVPIGDIVGGLQINTEVDKSIIPKTLGLRRNVSDQSCLVVFFSDGLEHERATSFIEEMKANHTGCVLVQSRQTSMQAGQAANVFGTDSYAMAVGQGPVIGLEYSGTEVCKSCQETLVTVSKGSTGLSFVSSSPAAAEKQIENFYNLADMQMNA